MYQTYVLTHSVIWKTSILTSRGQDVDLFPRTGKELGLIPAYGFSENYTQDINLIGSDHVETVVLMWKGLERGVWKVQ